MARPKKNDPRRVDVGLLRDAVKQRVESGYISWAGIARKMGWTRIGTFRWHTCEGEEIYQTPVGDHRKVMELTGQRVNASREPNKTIHAGLGAEIARLCGLDPVALGLELRAASRTTPTEGVANMGQRINCAVAECPHYWDDEGPYSSEAALRDGWRNTTGEPPDQPRVVIEWWWCPEHAPAVAA